MPNLGHHIYNFSVNCTLLLPVISLFDYILKLCNEICLKVADRFFKFCFPPEGGQIFISLLFFTIVTGKV